MKKDFAEFLKANGIIFLIFMFAAGLFPIIAAIFNWDWFLNHYKAAFITRKLGRNGARIFYALFGLFIILMTLVALQSGQVKF